MTSRYPGVALITSAGSDLGLAVVRSLIEAGCEHIVISDHSLDAIKRVQTAIAECTPQSCQVRVVHLDCDSDENWETMVQAANAIFGAINYCINCSELTPTLALPKATTDLEPSEFKAGLQESRKLWLCCRAELRQFLSQPSKLGTRSIVNIIPYGNFGTHPGHAILAATSYGRVGMTKTFAKDYGASGIRVNAVCPGLTVSQAGTAPVLQEHLESSGRLIDVVEIANAAVFMAGNSTSGMSGVSLPVDGGWSLVHN